MRNLKAYAYHEVCNLIVNAKYMKLIILSQTYNATRLWHVFRILMLRKTVYPTYDGQQSPMNKLGTKVLAF